MTTSVTQPRTGRKIQSDKIVRRRNQMRDDLLEAAIRLITAHGFAAVSVEDLIEDVGMSRRTFYGFFANKHELAAAVLNPIFDAAVAALKQIKKDKPPTLLPRLVDLYLILWHDHRSGLMLLDHIDDSIFPYIEQGHKDYGTRLKQLLKAAEKNGELLNDSADYSFRIVNRTAVRLLKVYQDHSDLDAEYRRSFLALISKPQMDLLKS